MNLFYFTFLILHDDGSAIITTTASSLESAFKILLLAESCPLSAVHFISQKPITF